MTEKRKITEHNLLHWQQNLSDEEKQALMVKDNPESIKVNK